MRTALLITALAGLAIFSGTAIAANTVTVHVRNFDFTNAAGVHFDPTITIGDTIHWVWDTGRHNTRSVVGSVEVWDSTVQNAPFSFDHTFTNAGDFVYYCQVHGSDQGGGTATGMSGVIHVTPAVQNKYIQTNLVSDVAGLASRQDTNLVNAWGLDKTPTGPWWVNSAGKGLSLLYDGTGAPNPLIVNVPGSPSPSSPTGIVYNPTQVFQIATGRPGIFLFVTENGTISGWHPLVDPTNAVIKVNRAGSAIYKGVARGKIVGQHVLYAANFFGSAIEVFDTNFNLVTLGPNAFKDPMVPAGYGPFNAQNINREIYVTWAQQNASKEDEVPGPGLGYVTVFTQGGAVVRRLQHGNWMNAPWGVALSPNNFGALSNMVLVGQFGSGVIVAFDPATGQIRNVMRKPNNQPVSIPGLWGISFGNGGSAGAVNTLYFAAGIGQETHGLFGSLAPQ